MNEASKKFLAELDDLLANAPSGIDLDILEPLVEARDSIQEDMSEGMSPGEQAAHEAMGGDAEEDAKEGEAETTLSPGQQAAQEVAANAKS